MQITERRIGQTVILDLVGELTYANRTAFKAAVERNRQAGCRHVILNMQGVRFFGQFRARHVGIAVTDSDSRARDAQFA